MTDRRRYKSIKQRYDVDVSRAVDPVRHGRRIVTWSACLVAVLAATLLLLGSHRAFEARPVSAAHQMFEQDCAQCHKQPFGPVGRLLSLDNGMPTVHNDSCQSCHPGKESRDHYAWSFDFNGDDQLERTGDCAECHQEHEHSGRLSLVNDRHCTKCHESLSETIAGHPRKPRDPGLDFASKITSFAADHPAFKRTSAAGAQKFRFNHALHLDPRGLPTANEKEGLRTLTCNSCHLADASGEYMQPISFESHCQDCHQLQVSKELNDVLIREGPPVPLPHVAPEEIRGVLRGRLMKYIEKYPDAIKNAPPVNPLQPPLKSEPVQIPAKDKWEWVERELIATEDRLFHAPEVSKDRAQIDPSKVPEHRRAALQMMCGICHMTSKQDQPADALVDWKIDKTGIPNRWLEHGRFPHNRHMDMRCIDCHYPPPASNATSGDGPPAVEVSIPEFSVEELKEAYGTRAKTQEVPPFLAQSIYASKVSRDVLIPDIDVCRKCHGKPRLAAATGSAPSNCVDCHDYHHSLDGQDSPDGPPHPRPPQGNEHPDRVLQFLTSKRAAE